MFIYNLIVNGKAISCVEELERIFDMMHLTDHTISPCPDRDYAKIGSAFIHRLRETANALNPDQCHDNRVDDTADNLHLTFRAGEAFLEIQYFEEGSALIGCAHTYYGQIYYLVNDYDNWNTLQRLANTTHSDMLHVHSLLGKQMLCCDGSIIRDIILHFCSTGKTDQQHSWVEDFSYTSPVRWHQDYLKSHLLGNFAWEERREDLIKLRMAQEAGKWQWGTPWPWTSPQQNQIHWENSDEMDYLGQLSSTKPPVSTELTRHEKLLSQTARRLQKAKNFEQRESGIRNLSFLKNCKNLRTLDLRCNDVEDLAPIASLENLRELTLDYNHISDLSPLAGLEQLRELHLRGNKVTSLEPLQALCNLTILNLRNNPLQPGTLSFLHKCKRLEMLDLAYTGIQDLTELEHCRAWSLILYGNPNLTGIEAIITMKKLTSLYLDLETAQQYDIPALMPRFTEYARYGNHVLYVWPEKYFD